MNAEHAGQKVGLQQAEEHLRRNGALWARGPVLRSFAVAAWDREGRMLVTGDTNADNFIHAYQEAYHMRMTPGANLEERRKQAG
jgi:hypothetical protein